MSEPQPDEPQVVYYDNGNVKYRGGYLDGEIDETQPYFVSETPATIATVHPVGSR